MLPADCSAVEGTENVSQKYVFYIACSILFRNVEELGLCKKKNFHAFIYIIIVVLPK
jgi:hypothetical protein